MGGRTGWGVHIYHICWVGSEFDQVCMAVVTSLSVCYIMIPGNSIRAEGAKVLAPALGRLTQLNNLGLEGE